MMKKRYVFYIISLILFLISCFMQKETKIIFEGIATLFLLEEEIEGLIKNIQNHKITIMPYLDIVLAICFFLFKEEKLFFIYKWIEQVLQFLFIKSFKESPNIEMNTIDFLKNRKGDLKKIYLFFLLFAGVLSLFLLNKERKVFFLFFLTILLLLKQNRLRPKLTFIYQASLKKIEEKNIILHKANALEQLQHCDEIILTKTGVLTYGEMEITKIIPVYQTKEDIFKYATLLEKQSNHSIAKAFHGKYKDKEEHQVSFISEMKGKGIRGVIDGMELVFGNVTLFEELNIKYPRVEFLHPTSMIAVDGTYVGTFVFKDEIRNDLEFLFPLLKEEGITKSVLLSSSSKEQIKKIASHLSITESYANLTLEDKLAILKNEKRFHRILYIDDVYQTSEFMKIADVTVSMKPNKNCDIEFTDGNINHLLFLRKEIKNLMKIRNKITRFYVLFLICSFLLAFLNYKNLLYISILLLFYEITTFYLLKSHKKNL